MLRTNNWKGKTRIG